MVFTQTTTRLAHTAIMEMLAAAIAKATEIGQPQCIVIVDASGESMGELRMSGAKYLSIKSARTKARTAASQRAPSSSVPEEFRAGIAAATQNNVTGLFGGLPVVIAGECIGGIGVGSGTGAQDVEVANAALAAIGAQTFE